MEDLVASALPKNKVSSVKSYDGQTENLRFRYAEQTYKNICAKRQVIQILLGGQRTRR